MRKRLFASLAAGAAALMAVGVAAAVTVTPANMNGWTAVNDTCGAASTGSIGFVTGPGAPPAGVGSVRFAVGANGDSYPTLRTDDYGGVRLSALTALDYWTYVSTPGASSQAPYLDIYVDWNGDNVRDDIITFEPVYNGAVSIGAWQRWNALGGQWWSNAMGGPPPLFTLAGYIASHPDASILAGDQSLILATGCGGAAWPNFVGSADALTVGVGGARTTYDFEPVIGPPTSKSECKKGGWKAFNNPTFKNQGQCVAYANHHDGKGKDG